LPIGLAISSLILGVIPYLAITPTGRILRLAGHDPLQHALSIAPRALGAMARSACRCDLGPG